MTPLLEQNYYSFPAGYLTPEEPPAPRVDSPIETRPTTANTRGNMDVPARDRTTSSSPSRPVVKKDTSESSTGLRFMVVGHPDELKDRNQMRMNRKHVMHTWLAKEAKNPDTKDTRVRKASGKRRQPTRETPPTSSDDTTLNTHAPSSIFRRDVSRLTPAESVHSNNSLHDTSDRENNHAAKKSTRLSGSSHGPALETAANRWHSPSVTDRRGPLVKGIGGYFENSRYMRAAVEDIPFSFKSSHPGDNIAGNLEPFGTWPSFSDPAINVNELKWKCSQRFGSQSLSMHWIPTILRARHAFLSTLCISSAHDDIMTRAILPAHLHHGESLVSRWKVRNGVIHMINESISDPEMRTADETIIAVLHVLNSEIMGCNDRSMRVHQSGLHAMVKERGGLDKLGAGGQLAFILTITNYLIAGLRESMPQRMYVEFASKQATKIPSEAQRLPESPLYSRPQGFYTINASLDSNPEMCELLNILRSLTNQFYIENSHQSSSTPTPYRTTESQEQSDETVTSLYGKVFATQPAVDRNFNSMSDRYMFEAVRLASLIYAQALANKIPFSKAASQVRSSNSLTENVEQAEPMPIKIKKALMRTDVSYCWDHLAGVLFWVTLIAGAAANPGPLANEDRVGENEDARKWLTAVAVRCCIVLSFEYGNSVLETLKRLLAIEMVLGQTEVGGETSAAETVIGVASHGDFGQQPFGPAEPPPLQRGFADFAEEFLSI